MAEDLWVTLRRDGVRLCCVDHRGGGVPAVLLLHGLAGHAGEWDATAAHLAGRHRVLCPDQRGHGRSDRRPADVSQDAFAADAAAWIEALGLAPAVVAGQSLGGLTAMLLAAQWPHLVRGLLVVEATPYPDPGAVERVRAWLAGWPVPFASREAALVFFGGDTAWARAWAGGLEERDDGLWPAFEPDVVLAALRAAGGDLGAAWAARDLPGAGGTGGRGGRARAVRADGRAQSPGAPGGGARRRPRPAPRPAAAMVRGAGCLSGNAAGSRLSFRYGDAVGVVDQIAGLDSPPVVSPLGVRTDDFSFRPRPSAADNARMHDSPSIPDPRSPARAR